MFSHFINSNVHYASLIKDKLAHFLIVLHLSKKIMHAMVGL